MFNHLHQLLAAAGAAVAGLALLFAKRPRAAPDAPVPAAPTSAPAQPTPLEAPSGPENAPDGLTARAAMELVGHEAIVCEAYKDSEGIWTWGIGVTDASGHNVDRYVDNPQTVERCLEVFIWLLRAKYLPAVIRAFHGAPLSEAQLAAALSFHYNTGAIGRASWVGLWISGDAIASRSAFMEWRNPPSIIERRQEECDLFFEARWSSDGKAAVIPVRKPGYQPNFRAASRIDVLPLLQKLLG